MTTPDDGLRPEEFAEAAAAAIEDVRGRDPREAAPVLARAGLLGVAAAEADGGLGLDIGFALPIAETAGRLQLRFPLLEQMLLARALSGTPQAGALVAGERLATIAWQGGLDEGLAGHASHVADCDWILVADDANGAALVEVAGATLEPDTALDPDSPQYWLRLDGARVVARLSSDACARLLDDARILLAGFVVGAAEGAIARTATHVATRVQFGRPLSAKQAVRHWMARMQLLTEASGAAVRRLLATDELGAARDTRPTLSLAIGNAAFVLEKAIHLHGGMGFTWEMPLHHSLRDIRRIDAAFGGGALAKQIGRRLIESA
ncbi:MAG: acyl-CoA dehydrogenase [Burkholderiaceae bacterium]